MQQSKELRHLNGSLVLFRDILTAMAHGSLSETYKPYLQAVREALEAPLKFKEFKRDPRYCAVLEHVDEELGAAYLDEMLRSGTLSAAEIERVKVNDMVGGARLCRYPAVGEISPSTLRYAMVAGELRRHFGDLKSFDIIEIGGGYGGQAVALDKIFRLGRYRIFDLPPVSRLVQKYLSHFELSVAVETPPLPGEGAELSCDLVISNYSFSELYPPVQMEYARKILRGAKRGYMIMNTGRPGMRFKNHMSLEELKTVLPEFRVLPEVPRSGPDNYVLVWGE